MQNIWFSFCKIYKMFSIQKNYYFLTNFLLHEMIFNLNFNGNVSIYLRINIFISKILFLVHIKKLKISTFSITKICLKLSLIIIKTGKLKFGFILVLWEIRSDQVSKS